MSAIRTLPNADLEVVAGNKSRWSQADRRRYGWHNLHRISRYSSSFRAARYSVLEKAMRLEIADDESVRRATSLPWFSALVVLKGSHILFERYARDFEASQPHSIQSITKTTLNLIIGGLVGEGLIDLLRPVSDYVPEIGSGYAHATIQQVLNMDVQNDYSEDFTNPSATYYRHEEAMGWRIPTDPGNELTEHRFLPTISSDNTSNQTGHVQYKDANTAVLAWVAERASGRPLRLFLADIVDAAGLEGAFHITTDREGTPVLEGGGCMTARDLARWFALFGRRGLGVNGLRVGQADFIERALSGGVPMPAPYEYIRYCNQMMVTGRALGHGGWGGQYALVNMDTGTVGVYLSVIENEHANNGDYLPPIIEMLQDLTARF